MFIQEGEKSLVMFHKEKLRYLNKSVGLVVI